MLCLSLESAKQRLFMFETICFQLELKWTGRCTLYWGYVGQGSIRFGAEIWSGPKFTKDNAPPQKSVYVESDWYFCEYLWVWKIVKSATLTSVLVCEGECVCVRVCVTTKHNHTDLV